MNEDELLGSLAHVARAQRAEADAFEQRARGDENVPEDAPEAPLSELAVLTMTAEAAASLGLAVRSRVVVVKSPQKPSRRSRGPVLRVVGTLALVVGLALVVRGRPSTAPSLPEYVVEVRGVAVALRAEPVEPRASLQVAVDRAARFEVVLRPASALPQAPSAWVFVERAGKLSPLDAKLEVAQAGSVRLDAPVAEVVDATTLRVVVAASGELRGEDDARAAATAGPPGTGRARVLVVPVER